MPAAMHRLQVMSSRGAQRIKTPRAKRACVPSALSTIDLIFVSSRRLTRDVVRHDAGEKITVFNVGKTDSRKKRGQFTRRIELANGVREVADTFHALGGAAEELCREPYREAQIDEVRNLYYSRFRAEHIVMTEDAPRFENAIDLPKYPNDLKMTRRELQRHGIE